MRRRPRRGKPPQLDEDLILSWADAYFARHGAWPKEESGEIPECYGETWGKVNRALRKGHRGLLPHSSLPLLLQERRGVFNHLNQPKLTVEQILTWADAHFERVGTWPVKKSGTVPESPGENWHKIDNALRLGLRGLAPKPTLARLLQERRGAFNSNIQKPLTVDRILEWADLHKQRHGKYPTSNDGSVDGESNETWKRIDGALRVGNRGLPAGSSLALILERGRSKRHFGRLPPHTKEIILRWADRHYGRTGRWPTENSGSVHDAPGETWVSVSGALRQGGRGLPGGSSLAQLLAAERGKQYHLAQPRLDVEQITIWLRAHTVRHGEPPTVKSGPIEDAPQETWMGVEKALDRGLRGLPGGSSLGKLKHDLVLSGVLPNLTEETILAWADAYKNEHGKWPVVRPTGRVSASIPNSNGKTWRMVDHALRAGLMGLAPGSSLSELLRERRNVVSGHNPPPLTTDQIIDWANQHRARHGKYPTTKSGAIEDCPGMYWSGIDTFLSKGLHGLPAGLSLARLLEPHRIKVGEKRPPLTVEQITEWLQAHRLRCGKYPSVNSGAIHNAPKETWRDVESALRIGLRGLPGASSLAKLKASLGDN